MSEPRTPKRTETHRPRSASLHPPPDISRLGRFPKRKLPPSIELWRAVRRGFGPWWFGNRGSGRFDLRAPRGTCYLSSDPLGAILEVIGPGIRQGAVSEQFLDRYRVRQLHLPRLTTLADLGSRRASGYGITAEIHTIVPYDLPQAWAHALLETGFGGLSYRLRHDPSTRAWGIALFGREGERRSWRRGRELSIAAHWRQELKSKCQIRVLPIPRSSELRVID